MRIQVLGTGCTKCWRLTANAERAVRELGLEVRVEKVEDVRELARLGVTSPPALVVDGRVRASGKVPSAGAIKALLSEASASGT